MVDCLCKMLRARATVLHASGVLTFVVATCFLPATLAQDAHSTRSEVLPSQDGLFPTSPNEVLDWEDLSQMCVPWEKTRGWPGDQDSQDPDDSDDSEGRPPGKRRPRKSKCVPFLEPCEKTSDCCANPDPSGRPPKCLDFGKLPKRARPKGMPYGHFCVFPDPSGQ